MEELKGGGSRLDEHDFGGVEALNGSISQKHQGKQNLPIIGIPIA